MEKIFKRLCCAVLACVCATTNTAIYATEDINSNISVVSEYSENTDAGLVSEDAGSFEEQTDTPVVVLQDEKGQDIPAQPASTGDIMQTQTTTENDSLIPEDGQEQSEPEFKEPAISYTNLVGKIGAFDVTVSGTMPEDARLHIEEVPAPDNFQPAQNETVVTSFAVRIETSAATWDLLDPQNNMQILFYLTGSEMELSLYGITQQSDLLIDKNGEAATDFKTYSTFTITQKEQIYLYDTTLDTSVSDFNTDIAPFKITAHDLMPQDATITVAASEVAENDLLLYQKYLDKTVIPQKTFEFQIESKDDRWHAGKDLYVTIPACNDKDKWQIYCIDDLEAGPVLIADNENGSAFEYGSFHKFLLAKVQDVILISQTLTKNIGNREVTVSGNIPENASLSVTEVPVTKTLEDKIGVENYNIELALDIEILVNGKPWQPSSANETLQINISNIDAASTPEAVEVYRIYDEEDIKQLQQETDNTNIEEVTQLSTQVDATDNSVITQSDHFTIYTIGTVEVDGDLDAYLCRGWRFNWLLKRLVNPEAQTSDEDNTITEIVWVDDPFTSDVRLDWYGTGEGDPKTAKIYARLNGTVVELYTPADKVFLNNVTTSGMFSNLRALQSVDLSKYDSSTATGLAETFHNCRALTSIDLSQGNWDTQNVTSMHNMFGTCTALTSVNLGDKFDTSKVTDMSYMFDECYVLSSLDLGNKFDTGNVTNFNAMFAEDYNITSINLRDQFDTSSATSMKWMFNHCEKLQVLNLGDKFDTTKVTDMRIMFNACNALTSLDLGDKFDTSNVTNMQQMFNGCNNLTTLTLGDKFDTSKVTDMSNLFSRMWKLETLDFGQSNFSAENATTIKQMFYEVGYYSQSWPSITLPDDFNASKVTSAADLFLDSRFDYIDLGANFNISSLVNDHILFDDLKVITLDLGDNFGASAITDMSAMFSSSSGPNVITNLILGNNFGGQAALNMSDMFSGCPAQVIDLGNGFHTENVTNMNGMFYGVTSCSELSLGDHFDTGKVTNMHAMFGDSPRLTQIDFDNNFDTSNVENMAYMFGSDANITSLNLGNKFNTSSVTNMKQMFLGMDKLNSLTLGNSFYTDKVTDFTSMFYYDKKLTNLDLSTFTVHSGTQEDTMLEGTTGLVRIKAPKTIDANAQINLGSVLGQNKKWYLDDDENGIPDTATYYSFMISGISDAPHTYIFHELILEDTTFVSGQTFNISLKKLSGSASPTTSTVDNTITDIKFIDTPFTSTTTVNSSGAAIYARLAGTEVELYTAAKNIYLNADCRSMFNNLKALSSCSIWEKVDTKNLTNASAMFGNTKLIEIDMLDKDFSALVTMDGMFNGMTSLHSLSLKDMSFPECTSMNGMLSGCTGLEYVDMSGVSIPKLTGMTGLFTCPNLKTVDLSGASFERLTNTAGMFASASKLTEINFTDINAPAIQVTGTMFAGCAGLTVLDLSDLDMTYAYNASSMFAGCTSLTKIIAPKNIGAVDVALPSLANNTYWYLDDNQNGMADSETKYNSLINNVSNKVHVYLRKEETKAYLISGSQYRTAINGLVASSKITAIEWTDEPFDDSADNAVKISESTSPLPVYARSSGTKIEMYSPAEFVYLNSNASSMFSGLYACTSIDTSRFVTSQCLNMSILFNGSSRLNDIGDLSDWDVSNVTDFSFMFGSGPKATYIGDLSNWDVSKGRNFNYMFQATTLSSYDMIAGWDVSNGTNFKAMLSTSSFTDASIVTSWNVSNGTDFSDMFSGSKITDLSPIAEWDVSKGTDFSNMFKFCDITDLDAIANWNVSKGTIFSYMFGYCAKLTDISGIANWDVSNGTNFSYMFSYDTNLSAIDISEWNISKGLIFTDIFKSCNNLKKIKAPKVVSEYQVVPLPAKKWYLDDDENLVADSKTGYEKFISSALDHGHIYIREDIPGLQFPYIETTLVRGQLINAALKSIANNETSNTSDVDTNIQTITQIEEPWSDYDNCVNIAEEGCEPVYIKAVGEYVLSDTDTKYAHTANYSDDGTESGNHANNLRDKQVVSIRGAAALQITIKYGIEKDSDMLYVFKGEYSGEVSQNMLAGQVATYSGYYSNINTVELTIPGDTATFAFYSNSYGAYHGYYAVIKPLVYTSDDRDIELFTYADKVFLNPDSSHMYENIAGIQELDLSSFDMSKVTDASDMFAMPDDYALAKVKTPVNVPAGITSELPETKGEAFWYLDDNNDGKCDNLTSYTKILAGESASHNYIKVLLGKAYLVSGSEFNQKLKQIQSNYTYINRIVLTNVPFDNTEANSALISTDTSPYPVYARYRRQSGTDIIEIYSSASVIYANEDSSHMFESLIKSSSNNPYIDISWLNTSLCTDFDYMFAQNAYMQSITGLKDMDVSNGVSFSNMFNNCQNITSLNVSDWNTSNATDFSSMFTDCTALTALEGINILDVSNGTDFSSMFRGLKMWQGEIDLSGWNVSNGTSFANMFDKCKNITMLDLSGWDISNASDTSHMFDKCLAMQMIKAPKSIGSDQKIDLYLPQEDMFWYLDDNGDSVPDNDASYTQLISGVKNTPHTYHIGNDTRALLVTGTEYRNRLNTLIPYSQITKIIWTDEAFDDSLGNAVKISIDSSPVPAYARVVGTEIEMYSAATKAYLNENSSTMFDEFSSVTYIDTTRFDTRECEIFALMFYRCSSLVNVDMSDWDMSSATTLERMFYDCVKLENVGNISSWDLGNCQSLRYVFGYCSSLQTLDLSNWKTQNVEDMYYSFTSCTSLKNLDVSNWDISSVTIWFYTFYNCTSLERLDLSKWDPKGTEATWQYVFYYCSNLNDLGDISGWDVSGASLISIFYGCGFEELNLSGWVLNEKMPYPNLTSGLNSLKKFTAPKTIPASVHVAPPYVSGTTHNWYLDDAKPYLTPDNYQTFSNSSGFIVGVTNTSHTYIRDDIAGFTPLPKIAYLIAGPDFYRTIRNLPSFYDAKTIVWTGEAFDDSQSGVVRLSLADSPYAVYARTNNSAIELYSAADTVYVNPNAASMFSGMSSIVAIDATGFDTSLVTDMSSMFAGTTNLAEIDLSSWDTSRVTNLMRTFDSCGLSDFSSIEHWDVSNVTNFYYTFYASGNNNSIDLSGWDTSSGTVFYGTLRYTNFTSVNISGWDLSKATTAQYMFDYSTKLTQVDVTNMVFPDQNLLIGYMFNYCPKLTTITGLSTWRLKTTNLGMLFYNCPLTHVDVADWDVSGVTNFSSMFYGAQFTELDLSGWELNASAYMLGGNPNLTKIKAPKTIASNARFAPPYSEEGHKWYLDDAEPYLTPDTYTAYENSKPFINGIENKSHTYIRDDIAGFTPLPPAALLLSGNNFKEALSQIIELTEITAFAWDAQGFDTETEGVVKVSTDDTPYGVYARLDGTTIKLYGECETIYLNADSEGMFKGMTHLASLDLAGLDAKYVTTMKEMFAGCTGLKTLDLAGLVISNGINVSDMFTGTENLAQIQAPHTIGSVQIILPAKQDATWHLDDMTPVNMPDNRETYTSMINNVTNVSHNYIRSDKEGFTIPVIAEFDRGFVVALKLKQLANTQLSLAEDDYTQLSVVMEITDNYITSIRWSDEPFDTNSENVIRLESADSETPIYARLNGTIVDVYTPADLVYLNERAGHSFINFYALKTLPILSSKIVTSNVNSFYAFCYNDRKLQSVDLSRFDTSKATTFAGMFYNCQTIQTLDVSGFNTSNVTTMASMFAGCRDLKALDLSGFDTSNVTDMSVMFNECQALTSMDISNFDISKTAKFSKMFNRCSNLVSVKLPDPDKALKISEKMFASCDKLSSVSGFTHTVSIAPGAFKTSQTEDGLYRFLQFTDYENFTSDCWLSYDWHSDNRTTCIYYVTTPALYNVEEAMDISISSYVGVEDIVVESDRAIELTDINDDSNSYAVYVKAADIGIATSDLDDVIEIKPLASTETNIIYIDPVKQQDDNNAYYMKETYKISLLKKKSYRPKIGTYHGNFNIYFSTDLSAG